jgi:hypothetical protein
MVYVSHMRKLFFAVLPHFRVDNCERSLTVPTYSNRYRVVRISIQANSRTRITIACLNCKQYEQTIVPDLNFTLEGLLLSLFSFAYSLCCLFYFYFSQLLILYENKMKYLAIFYSTKCHKNIFSTIFLIDKQTTKK